MDAAAAQRDVADLHLHDGALRVESFVCLHPGGVALVAVCGNDVGAVGQVGVHVGLAVPGPKPGVIMSLLDEFDFQAAAAGIGLVAQGCQVELVRLVM